MALDENMFRVALDAYYGDTGTVEGGIRKAIEAYLAEMFTPGQVMTMEPLEAIPKRDYRKEAWIAAIGQGNPEYANLVLQHFDATFPPEPTNG